MAGARTAIISRSLTLSGPGPHSLWSAERHGKRQDVISQERRVYDEPPVVWGKHGLNLRAAFDEHVSGARMNAGLKKPVLHFLMQFPSRPSKRPTMREGRTLVRAAVKFVQETHGGNAVFAARLDRDEKGAWTVDVFAAPRYEKRTKRTPPDEKGEDWISNSKHGRELCEKHRKEIVRRHSKGKFTTGPRQCGIALQSEWRAFLTREAPRLELAPKNEKAAGPKDRLEPEEFKIKRDREKLEADRAKLAQDRERLDGDRKKLAGDREALEAETGMEKHGRACLEAGLEMISEGTLLPEPKPGHWGAGPNFNVARKKDQAMPMVLLLTSGWWHKAGRTIWETIIRPAAAVRWGGREGPGQAVDPDTKPEGYLH